MKNKNSVHCCHYIDVAVLRVQGPSVNIEQIRNLQKQSENDGMAADEMSGGWSDDQFCKMVKIISPVL